MARRTGKKDRCQDCCAWMSHFPVLWAAGMSLSSESSLFSRGPWLPVPWSSVMQGEEVLKAISYVWRVHSYPFQMLVLSHTATCIPMLRPLRLPGESECGSQSLGTAWRGPSQSETTLHLCHSLDASAGEGVKRDVCADEARCWMVRLH